jgi:urease accessory protein
MKQKFFFLSLGLCAYTLILPVVEAHTLGVHNAGLAAGFVHPFLGLDHLLAMIAVGIWAAQLGGKAVWFVPFTFVSVMFLAASLGSLGFYLPLVEPVIACSVLVLGLLIASSVRLPTIAVVGIVGLFAVFHGYAHGLEVPQLTSPIIYGIGFVLATALLHGIGIGFEHSSRQYKMIQRVAGYSLIVTSGFLLITS